MFAAILSISLFASSRRAKSHLLLSLESLVFTVIQVNQCYIHVLHAPISTQSCEASTAAQRIKQLDYSSNSGGLSQLDYVDLVSTCNYTASVWRLNDGMVS